MGSSIAIIGFALWPDLTRTQWLNYAIKTHPMAHGELLNSAKNFIAGRKSWKRSFNKFLKIMISQLVMYVAAKEVWTPQQKNPIIILWLICYKFNYDHPPILYANIILYSFFMWSCYKEKTVYVASHIIVLQYTSSLTIAIASLNSSSQSSILKQSPLDYSHWYSAHGWLLGTYSTILFYTGNHLI